MGSNRNCGIEIDFLKYERQASAGGYTTVAGLDEAGRGALCGPVVAAAVVFPTLECIPGVNDSKKLTARKRDSLFQIIRDSDALIGIGCARASEIDRINILEATRLAMGRAVKQLSTRPDYLLLDAIELHEILIEQKSIIKGDSLSHSIAAASIIAKVTRDRIMTTWAARYPEYGWTKNKGYGTAEHLAALSRLGPSPVHRRTFKGVYDCHGLFD